MELCKDVNLLETTILATLVGYDCGMEADRLLNHVVGKVGTTKVPVYLGSYKSALQNLLGCGLVRLDLQDGTAYGLKEVSVYTLIE